MVPMFALPAMFLPFTRDSTDQRATSKPSSRSPTLQA